MPTFIQVLEHCTVWQEVSILSYCKLDESEDLLTDCTQTAKPLGSCLFAPKQASQSTVLPLSL